MGRGRTGVFAGVVLALGFAAACRGAAPEAATGTPPVVPGSATPAGPAGPAGADEAAPVVYRGEFVASPFDPSPAVVLRRATTRFHGVDRGASLSHVPRVGDHHWGALLLTMDDRPDDPVVVPLLFTGDPTTARLAFRELHGELYLELRVEQPDSPLSIDETFLLYRIGDDQAPRWTLSERVSQSRGRCRRFETAELVERGTDELDIVVRGRPAPGFAGERACDGPMETRRRLQRQGGCYGPPGSDMGRPTCVAIGCAPGTPEAKLARALVERGREGTVVVTAPGSWQRMTDSIDRRPMRPSVPSAPWLAFRAPSGCRVDLLRERLATPSLFLYSLFGGDLSELTNSWLMKRCERVRSVEPGEPKRCKFEGVAGWSSCGELYRSRMRKGSRVFEAVALRIPRADGVSTGLLVTLECDKARHEDGVRELEDVLEAMRFEPAIAR